MTPATRESLGLRPLPPDQARRIEAQHRALCAGQGARWPEGLEPHDPLRRQLPVAQTHELAQRVNALNAQRSARAEAAAGFVVALVLGILGGLALVHYGTPCAAGHLCMGLAYLVPQRRPVQTPAAGDMVARAWADGYEAAEREHYTQAWRLGVGHGLLAGVALGAAGMAAAFLLGQMVG